MMEAGMSDKGSRHGSLLAPSLPPFVDLHPRCSDGGATPSAERLCLGVVIQNVGGEDIATWTR